MKYFKLNLQRFAEEGEAAAVPETATAETAPAAESTENFQIQAGDTLADGQVVQSPQVAAAMNRQMEKHPELRKVYGQGRKQAGQAQAAPATENQAAEKTIEERWNEAKKGEFAALYGADVQKAVQDRFKNQADAEGQLKKLEPMLGVLQQRAGVKSVDELISHVMDDDSLYEEAANEAGMTVAAYREFQQMQAQLEEAKARENESMQQEMFRQHLAKLSQQAEEFRQQFPNFDLMQTLQNDPNFARLTSPEVGLNVRDAYFALHHDELAPQMLAAGMERAKQQMSQTIQAQRRRPAEGAMKTQPQAADFNMDIRQLNKAERSKLYQLIHQGKVTWG